MQLFNAHTNLKGHQKIVAFPRKELSSELTSVHRLLDKSALATGMTCPNQLRTMMEVMLKENRGELTSSRDHELKGDLVQSGYLGTLNPSMLKSGSSRKKKESLQFDYQQVQGGKFRLGQK